MKSFWIGVVDGAILFLVISLFFFSDSLLITGVMFVVLAMVIDRYIIARKCYLAGNK